MSIPHAGLGEVGYRPAGRHVAGQAAGTAVWLCVAQVSTGLCVCTQELARERFNAWVLASTGHAPSFVCPGGTVRATAFPRKPLGLFAHLPRLDS